MLKSEKALVGLLLQISSFMLLAIFAYITYPVYPHHLWWALGAALLFVYGRIRPVPEALAVCSAMLLAYGSYVYYGAEWSSEPHPIGWNELVWLIVFPAFAFLGASGRGVRGDTPDLESAYFGSRTGDQQGDPQTVILDERLGFSSANAFLYKMEEKVLVSLRERRTFRLMLVKVEHFREFKLMFGEDHAQTVLSSVAEWIADFEPEAKAQVGESLLAAILSSPDPVDAEKLQEELNRKFFELQLSRPRREAAIKLKLRFGFAECPADGIEAKSLLDKARIDLSWNGIESN